MPASGDPQTSGREPVALRRACCRLTVWAMRLVWMCVLLMFVGWALGGTWWVCDLVNHFWPLGAVLLTASALCLGLCRRWWEVGIAAVALAVNLAAIVPYYIPATVPPGMPLRVVVSNLYSGNPTPAAAIRFLESTDADVLVRCRLCRTAGSAPVALSAWASAAAGREFRDRAALPATVA
jgi:hypothetical protein